MSEADIETLRAGYAAVSRADWDAAMLVAHPNLEWITPDRVLLPGTYRGPEAVRRYFEEQAETFEEVTVEPEEFFERGDQIVAFVLICVRPRGSTAMVQSRIGHLWTMCDGKATRCEVFPQREKALEAVGLSEQDARGDS
jgi:ketosteroid isomerase-like protein